jgi:hypothetical protein
MSADVDQMLADFPAKWAALPAEERRRIVREAYEATVSGEGFSMPEGHTLVGGVEDMLAEGGSG